MSHEYCLPITLELDSSNGLEILLVLLYLLPLIPVWILFDMVFAVGSTLVYAGLCSYDLKKQSALKTILSIQVNQKGNWVLLDREKNAQDINFKNFIRIGPVLFLLFTLDGRRQRVLICTNRNNPSDLHNLRIYLRNCAPKNRIGNSVGIRE